MENKEKEDRTENDKTLLEWAGKVAKSPHTDMKMVPPCIEIMAEERRVIISATVMDVAPRSHFVIAIEEIKNNQMIRSESYVSPSNYIADIFLGIKKIADAREKIVALSNLK